MSSSAVLKKLLTRAFIVSKNSERFVMKDGSEVLFGRLSADELKVIERVNRLTK